MRRHLGWIVGLAIVALGVVLQLTAPHDFGWFAYAGRGSVDFNGVVLLTDQGATGVGVTVLGLLVLAAWIGFALGRRKRAD